MTTTRHSEDSDQSASRRQRRRRVAWLALSVAATTLAGCQQQRLKSEPLATIGPASTVVVSDNDSTLPHLPLRPPHTEDTPAENAIWIRLRQGFRLSHIRHPRIARQIALLRRSPNDFHALMARAEPYLHYILDRVEQAGLPTELALLPGIESGFRTHVYSPDGAAGLWQFMPATGRMMGLRQDWWFDKRRTVRGSTDAAMAYLQRLNERFSGDWLHTLAAYNAGSAKVKRAIRRAKRRGERTDFWSLDLPGETDVYVPRLLALAAIVADPDHYQLTLPWIGDRPYFANAGTAGQIDLNIAAELAGMPVEQVLALNAGHKRWATRPDGPHELLLPVARVETFQTALAALPPDQRLRWQRHQIRRGESLNRIARRYGVTAEAIRRSNGLRDARIRAGDTLLIPLSENITLADVRATPHARQRLRYKVRKGDSLYTIARRFQVSIADLRRWNSLGRYIHPGERLTVYIDPDA